MCEPLLIAQFYARQIQHAVLHRGKHALAALTPRVPAGESL